ncbi:tetratricopeptide repeat protein [Candidatus Purcelliella pentastirinorum]|uniref:Tetratricopeptide repeat protein n=1 Tax=Candidatus Purcelliella pentastirinorum TaxID=472834 RepID=A0AAX3NAA3_9ENTR|nr:tetratricopeptide repeat protein [Candidatus Purcelliella pentastirinorum]WDI78456.1 tetratricopeptide repeat protein [Candidatus Purcelliella pentastirinorum]WDR80515.1 tetratricopeptide repeat protein [Candidatus Purcelliella pentastirinorum]
MLNKNCNYIFDYVNKDNIINVFDYIRNNHNIYGFINILKLSKYYVDIYELKNAEFWLKYGIKYIKDDNLKAIFSIRLVRILYQENKFIESLSIIKCFVNMDSWKYVFLNIKGDILLSIGDRKNAKKIWLYILNNDNNIFLKYLVKLKINSIY